jgi:hypothetical protein
MARMKRKSPAWMKSFTIYVIPNILWGDEILADMPSRLGGEDNRINVT